jgi:hypothetical protein
MPLVPKRTHVSWCTSAIHRSVCQRLSTHQEKRILCVNFFTTQDTRIAPFFSEKTSTNPSECSGFWNRFKETRGPKRKVGRAPRRACCLRQNIQPGSAHTPKEPFSRALLGQRARRCLYPAGLGAGGREGVVRVEPLPPLAQQLFQPSACARKASHMSPLLLLWCAVIRALDLYIHACMYDCSSWAQSPA